MPRNVILKIFYNGRKITFMLYLDNDYDYQNVLMEDLTSDAEGHKENYADDAETHADDVNYHADQGDDPTGYVNGIFTGAYVGQDEEEKLD